MFKKLVLVAGMTVALAGCAEGDFVIEEGTDTKTPAISIDPIEEKDDSKAKEFWEEKHKAFLESADATEGIRDYFVEATEDFNNKTLNKETYQRQMLELMDILGETISIIQDIEVEESVDPILAESGEHLKTSLINANGTLKNTIDAQLSGLADEESLKNMLDTFDSQMSGFKEAYGTIVSEYDLK